MTRKEMNELVASELEHIPNWPGEHQKQLRFLYNAVRRSSLGKKVVVKPSAGVVLRDCIARLRRVNPGAQVHYEWSFFQGK
jgi:hypothetical protein